MLENIRKRWNEQTKKVEAEDIKSCRKHPRVWIGMMLFYPTMLAFWGVYIVIQEEHLVAIAIMLMGVPAIGYIEKILHDRYKKAFPKSS